MNRLGEIAVGLVGLLTLASALTSLPMQIQLSRALPLLERAALPVENKAATAPMTLETSRANTLIVIIATLLPGLLVLVARRRIAAWLLPDAHIPSTGIMPEVLLRVALAVLGCYLVATGLASAASVGSTRVRFGDLAELRSVTGFAGPLVKVGCGVALCRMAPWLSRRLASTGANP